MNTEGFIARRLTGSENKSFTSVIVKIAIAAIALSIAVMIVTTSMIAGFKNQITEKIFGFWGHIHIYDNNISRSFETVPIDISQEYYQQLLALDQIDYQRPADIAGVKLPGRFIDAQTQGGIDHIQSFTMLPGILTTRTEVEGIFAKGVGEDFDWDRMSRYMVEGKKLSQDTLAKAESVISRTIANRMRLKIGDKFNLRFIINEQPVKRQFLVSGIYNTGLDEYDKKFILVGQSRLNDVLGWTDTQVGGIEIFVDKMDDIHTISEFIYYDVLPANLYAETIREKFANIFEWLELQDINEIVILILMIIVSIINMITALLILILERSKMIGTLKALGMRNWGIRKIFVHQAGYIIVRGLIIGTVAGVGMCLLQQYFGFITLNEKNYYLAVAPIEISWIKVIIINVVTFVTTLLFLVLPTYLVTRISPVKALRFD